MKIVYSLLKNKVVPQEFSKLSRHGGSLSSSPPTLSLSSTEAKRATGKVCTKMCKLDSHY